MNDILACNDIKTGYANNVQYYVWVGITVQVVENYTKKEEWRRKALVDYTLKIMFPNVFISFIINYTITDTKIEKYITHLQIINDQIIYVSHDFAQEIWD